MRNLKRALSLALATVMTLGLMVVGTGAVGYDDVADTDNVEAIEVLQAVGIMTGDENGNFNPDNTVTRNEMAVIMSQLLNLDYNYYRGTNPFTDVPQWAAPYVAACAAEGVTSGVGGGLYNGEGNVTAAQAALMIMKTLGYFQYQNDFDDDWQVATIRQASYINLFEGIDASAEEALTRNQIAQLVLNGLKSNMVEFTGNVGATIGDVVINYQPEYSYRTSAASRYNTIDVGTTNIAENDQYYIQLGEELYDGDLELRDSTDPFGRPARMWEYDGEEIGTYVKTELLREEYTVGVSGQDMYNLLGNAVVKDDDYSLVVYVDGWEYDVVNNNNPNENFTKENFTRNNKATMENTGKGVLTQVYVDTQAEEITVAIINTYLAKASSDYNEKTEKLAIKVYDDATGESKTLLVEDFPGIEDVQEGDFMLVNWADEDKAPNKKTVVNIMDVESISDVTVSKFSASATKVTSMTVDGTKYDAAAMLNYESGTLSNYNDNLLTNKTYNIYFDQYGYAIGAELYSGDDQYVFITGYDLNSSNIANQTADAAAIFTDGTMKTIKVDVKETNKAIQSYNDSSSNSHDYYQWLSTNESYLETHTLTWYTYTLDESNDIYTLTPVGEKHQMISAVNTAENINSKSVRLNGTNERTTSQVTGLKAYGNDDSVYITVDADTVNGVANVIDEVTGVYTGVQDVDITSRKIAGMGTVYTVFDSDQYVIASVILGTDNGSTSDYAYIFAGAKSEEKIGTTYYWEFDAVTEEGIQTLQVKTKYLSVINVIQNTLKNTGDSETTKFANGYLFKLNYDADGYVVSVKLYSDSTLSGTYIFVNDDQNWDEEIKNQVVRYMNVGDNRGGTAADDSDELILIGNTLYNNDEADDVGLPLHPDAKFVVAQEEYGKFEKTEYDDIDAALDALADYDTSTENALDFQGTISAVLDDSGRAIWVVFDSNGGFAADKNEGSSNGSIKKVTLGKDGNITFNAGADTSETYEAKLYKYADDTGKYGLIWEGEYKYGDPNVDIDKTWITEKGSYYVEIDGVPSNVVRVP